MPTLQSNSDLTSPTEIKVEETKANDRVILDYKTSPLDAPEPVPVDEVPALTQEEPALPEDKLVKEEPVLTNPEDYNNLLSLEQYQNFNENRDEYSAEEQAAMDDIYGNYLPSITDQRWLLNGSNLDLPREVRENLQNNVNVADQKEHLKDLFMHPEKAWNNMSSGEAEAMKYMYIQNGEPTPEAYKLIMTTYLSDAMGLPMEDVSKNYESIKAVYFNGKTADELTFDAISDEDAFAWVRDSYYEQAGTMEDISIGMSKARKAWNDDDKWKDLDQDAAALADQISFGIDPGVANAEIERILAKEQSLINEPSMSTEGDNWFSGAGYSAISMGSRIGSSWWESKEEAAAGALAGGVIGSVVPGPGTLAGAKIGASKGFALGQFNFWWNQGKGTILRAALRHKKGLNGEDMNPEIASAYAQVGGVAYALVENLGGLNKLPAVQNALKRKLISKGLVDWTKKTTVNISKNVSKEIVEEGIQKGIEDTSAARAAYYSGTISGDEYMDEILEDVPINAVKEMYDVLKDGGILLLGGTRMFDVRMEAQEMTPKQRAKMEKKTHDNMKALRDKTQERIVEMDKEAEAEVDSETEVEPEVQESRALRRKSAELANDYYEYTESLNTEEIASIEREVTKILDLPSVHEMSTEELAEESDMDINSPESKMKAAIEERRALHVYMPAPQVKFNQFIARVMSDKSDIGHERISKAFAGDIKTIQDKKATGVELTEQEQQQLKVHNEFNISEGVYAEGLRAALLETSIETPINKTAKFLVDTGRLATEDLQQFIEEQRANPDAVRYAQYISQISDVPIVFTGAEHTFQSFVDEKLMTEKQAIKKLQESGKLNKGESAALSDAVIKGFNSDGIAYVSATGDITTVMEEVAEVYFKSRAKSDPEFIKEMTAFQETWNKENGVTTDQSLLEFFSDRSIDYNARDRRGTAPENKLVRQALQKLGEVRDLILRRVATLHSLIKQGKISKSVEKALKDAKMPLLTDETTDLDFQTDLNQISNVNAEEAQFTEPESEMIEERVDHSEENGDYAKNSKKEFVPTSKEFDKAKLLAESRISREYKLIDDLDKALSYEAKVEVLIQFANKWLFKKHKLSNASEVKKLADKAQKASDFDSAVIAAQEKIMSEINKQDFKTKDKSMFDMIEKNIDKKELKPILTEIKEIRQYDADRIAQEKELAANENDIIRIQKLSQWDNNSGSNSIIDISEAILADIIKTGQENYIEKTKANEERINKAIDMAVKSINGEGGKLTQVSRKNKKLSVLKRMNLSTQTLGSLLDLITNTDEARMEGELVKWWENGAQKADDVKDALFEEMNESIITAIKKYVAKTEAGINQLSEKQDESGVFIRGEEWALSYLDAVAILAYEQNESAKAVLRNTGINETTINQIDNFLDKYVADHQEETSDVNIKAFQDWVFNFTNQYVSQANNVHRSLIGTPLVSEANYLPLNVRFRESSDTQSRDGVNKSAYWGLIQERQAHTHELDLANINILGLLYKYAEETSSFIGKAEFAFEANQVLTSVEVTDAIEFNYGSEHKVAITDRLESWERGGLRKDANLSSFDAFLRNYTRARIMGKVGNTTKQLASTFAYANDMPVGEFVRRTKVGSIREFVDRFNELKELSPWLRERLKRGGSSEFRNAHEQNRLYNFLERESFINRIGEMGMMFTKFGDIGAIVAGGYALYDYKKAQYISEGMSTKEATKQAIVDFENYSSRMQQSGKSKDISNIQEADGLSRLFILFQNSQFAYWRTINSAISAYGKDRGNKAELAKVLAISAIVLPMSFATISLGNKATWMAMTGFTIDDDEEDLLRQMAWSLLLSPLAGLPSLIGQFTSGAAGAAANIDTRFVGQMPVLQDTKNLFGAAKRMLHSDTPMSRNLRSTADAIGLATGINFKEFFDWINQGVVEPISD
jgi:hypothetical protein